MEGVWRISTRQSSGTFLYLNVSILLISVSTSRVYFCLCIWYDAWEGRSTHCGMMVKLNLPTDPASQKASHASILHVELGDSMCMDPARRKKYAKEEE